MARIKAMPAIKIIGGFKGVLDFYFWKGIPCVRAWPKSPIHSRSQAVQSTWPAFAYSAKAWYDLDPSLRELYNHQAAGTHMTGKDLFMRSYLSGAFKYPTGV